MNAKLNEEISKHTGDNSYHPYHRAVPYIQPDDE